MHYGFALDFNFPINQMLDAQLGAFYYFPETGSKMDNQAVGFIPFNLAIRSHIPGMGVGPYDFFVGLGVNYATWIFSPSLGRTIAPDLGYFGFIRFNLTGFSAMGGLLFEIGYSVMRGSIDGGNTKLESSGIYLKGILSEIEF